jgi:diguanylate cyclase (GGDEF)-like protein
LTRGPTLGVLSTWFGGSYFGDLLGGMAESVAARNGRLVAIQTLDAGTFSKDFTEAPPFTHRVAWNHISGFIIILNAANVSYLEAARSSGLPVVVISDTPVGFDCPIIFADNFSGVRASTQHLIDHGHRKIAFVGLLGLKDVGERYQAYRETLLANGLTPDPDLLYEVDDMQESSGEQAARAMLAAGLPSTAVITGNDQNALGLIRALTAAGLTVPADQAVIGFDGTEAGARLTPSLTSVKQPMEEIGALAVQLLTDLVDGREVANGIHLVATSLVVRESCGCSDPLAPAATGVDDETVHDVQGLLSGIKAVLELRQSEREEVEHAAELAVAVQGITEALRAGIEGTEGLDGLELRRMLSPLTRMFGNDQHAVQVTRLLSLYARHLQAEAGLGRDVDVTRRVEDRLHRIFILLAQAHTSLLAAHAKSLMTSLVTQNLISMDLLRSQERDPRSLDWLQLTEVRGGCLGLWPADQETDSEPLTTLNVVRVFDRKTGGVEGPRAEVALESFPPAEVMAMADIARDDMVYIAHLKVGPGDWGMLALVGPIQAKVEEGRETMNQWAALLSVALEHEAVLKTMREQEEDLRRAALYDELTGLPNRAYFRSRLTTAIARAGRRADYKYAVLMLDLDGFKLVNDSLGHLSGDRLLEQVAARLAENLRTIDTPARFGGDEFAVLMEEIADTEGPVILAERLQKAFAAPHDLGDTEVVVSASIGIAIGNADYSDTETLMRDADAAMYYAKSHGKRSHAIFDPSMHAAAVNRLQIEGELRAALENDELALHYQSIVDLRTGSISGAEALIRWQHPTRGLLAPGEFLTVAEESGLILPIGTWVLDEACRQLQAWGYDQPHSRHFMMSVNVSNRQFWRSPLIDNVEHRLHSHGLDPSRLAIEITEGVIMDDVKLASAMLSGLKTMGVQVHIDDFGTGYSSLEALHDLSIHALKIDRSFISRLSTSPRSRELVRTIVTMGLNLDLDVIAEGIETPAELDFVRTLGCTHGQGYLFSRPVPAQQLKALIDAEPTDRP